MPQTFDLCVMSNILLFISSRGYELNEFDLASIQLIKEMIDNDDHIEKTVDVSHHSNSPALVLHHVARLIAMDDSKMFEDLRDKVVTDLISISEETENEMEQIMIATSLLRLGQKTDYQPDYNQFEDDARTFSFFEVNPFNISKGKSKYLPSVTWVCEAYNLVLLTELIVMRKKQN